MKNQIKKVLSIVLVVVMCLSTFAIGVAAEECKHENKIHSGTTKATCTGYGYDSYKCADCNKDFVENIVKPLGHNLVQTGETIPASCWREEASVWECDREGCDEKEVRGELTGEICEKFVDADKDGNPDVTFEVVDGELVGSMICADCGYKHTTDCECGEYHPELVVTAGHSHEVEDMEPVLSSVVKPTCDTEGEITYKCKECAFTAKVVIEKTHQLTKHEAVAHTCTKDGNIEYYTCDLCEKYFVTDKDGKYVETTADKVVDPKAHTLKPVDLDATTDGVQYDYVKEENCVIGQKAVYKVYCEKCDYTGTLEAEKLVHDYVVDKSSYDATCVKYGHHVEVCTKCGDDKSVTIDPKGFVIGLGADKKLGTEDDVVASLADLLTNEEYIKLATTKEAACGGYAQYVYTVYAQCGNADCEYCVDGWDSTTNTGKIYVNYGEKKAHVWKEADDSAPKAATCTEPGQKAKFVCECGAVDPDRDGSVIDALGHKWSDEILYCSVEKIAKKVCTVCEAITDLTADELKEFTAPEGVSHVTITYKVVDPTCVKDGEKITYCAVCHHIDDPEVLKATGHNYSEEATVIPGSCQEKTLYVYSCVNEGCDGTVPGHNKVVEGDYDKSPAGHMAAMEKANDVATKKVLRPATCTVKELAEYTCTQCNVTYTVTGDYGHDVVDKTVDPDCTTETNGKTGKWCNDCEKWVGETTEIPFEHNEDGVCKAQSECGNEYGWPEFKYCTVCEAAEQAAKDAAIAAGKTEWAKSKKSLETVKATVQTKGHVTDTKTSEKIDSTCTEVGVKEFTYCAVCENPDEIIAAAKKDNKNALHIAKKEHMKETKVEKVADCVNVGFDLKYCANCSEALVINFDYENGHEWIDEDEDDILDFNLDDSITNTKYDCTKDGYKYYACANCDAHKVIEETRVPAHHVDAKGNDFTSSCLSIKETTTCIHGHDVEVTHKYYADVKDAKLPTATEEGYIAHICADCGDKQIKIRMDLATLFEKALEDANLPEDYKIEITADHAIVKFEVSFDGYTESGWVYFAYDAENEYYEEELDALIGWDVVDSDEDLVALLENNKIKVVEDKCVDPTHTTEGKFVYVCPCCEAEVEVVLDKLTGIDMDITADSGILAGANVVNGGLVEFTVALNAAELEASILKADFYYDPEILTFVGAEIEGIFDVTDEAGTLVIETNKVVTTKDAANGHVSVIVDASYTSNKLPVNVELNANDIAFVTLTFRVAKDANGLAVIEGLVSEVANVKGEMLVNIDLSLIDEYYEIMDNFEELWDAQWDAEIAFEEADKALADAIQAQLDAEATGDANYIALAKKAVAEAQAIYDVAEKAAKAADKAVQDAEDAANEWLYDNFEDFDELYEMLDAAYESVVECEFEITELGNINGDRAINTVDALAIRQMAFTNMDGKIDAGEYYLADLEAEADEEGNYPNVEVNYLAEADINMDGVVGLDDYAILNQYLVGNITYEALVLTSQTVVTE